MVAALLARGATGALIDGTVGPLGGGALANVQQLFRFCFSLNEMDVGHLGGSVQTVSRQQAATCGPLRVALPIG